MQYDTKTIFLNNDAPIAGDKFTENKFTVKGEQKIIFDLSNIKKETIDTSNNVATATVDGTNTVTTATAKVNMNPNGLQSNVNLVLDNNSGTIAEGMFVTGNGIIGTTRVVTVTDQNNIVLDRQQTIADNVDLTFKSTSNIALKRDSEDFGIVIPGMFVTGTGISSEVRVLSAINQNSIKLSSPIALSNNTELTFTLKVLSTIYKTKADWGDGREDYYESEFNFDTLRFEPPKTIEHTYSITTSADVIKGVIFFEYQNGLTSFAQLCAYCSRANLIDLQMKNLENQLFVVEDIKKLTTYVDKNNNLYNLALTPTMLTRYDSSQQDIIEIPEDERAFLQTSEIGDEVNALSATDIQAKNTPSRSAIDYTKSKFVVY